MIRVISIGLALAIALAAPGAYGCATCFGAEDSAQTHGLNMAIFTLLGTTYALFGSMAAIAFLLWRKSRRVDELPEDSGPIAQGSDASAAEIVHG